MQQLWGRAGAVVSTCMQQLGAGLDRGAGTQTQSDAIRCHHMQSDAITRSRHSDAIRRNQMSSRAIDVLQMPSDAPRCPMRISHVPCAQSPCRMPCGNQMQSDALRSHLCHAHKAHPACHVQSDAIRCTQISPVPCAQSPSRMPCATASNRRQGPSG